jgi:hypothetical protein
LEPRAEEGISWIIGELETERRGRGLLGKDLREAREKAIRREGSMVRGRGAVGC